MRSFFGRNQETYYVYSVTKHRYEYSFASLRYLMAYLAHYNIYLDSDHKLYHDFANNCFNDYSVNYFVGLRIANSWDEVETVIDVSSYKKKSISKLVKITGVQYKKDDKTFITKDLIILNDKYEVYTLDLEDIDAILNRICNYTDYKSNLDFPDFKYRFSSVPGVHRCRSYGLRHTNNFNSARSLQNYAYDLQEYTGVKSRVRLPKDVRELLSGWDYRVICCDNSWKQRKDIKKQWQKHLI